MIKVEFKEINNKPKQDLLVDDEYIPFSLKVGGYSNLPETIYARNIHGENFIEFRFDKHTKLLYEITLVALQPTSINIVKETCRFDMGNTCYSCLIEDETELDISIPIEILQGDQDVRIIWSKNDLTYFSISNNCILGIDENQGLGAVILEFLSSKQIEDILAS